MKLSKTDNNSQRHSIKSDLVFLQAHLWVNILYITTLCDKTSRVDKNDKQCSNVDGVSLVKNPEGGWCRQGPRPRGWVVSARSSGQRRFLRQEEHASSFL